MGPREPAFSTVSMRKTKTGRLGDPQFTNFGGFTVRRGTSALDRI